MNAAQVKRIRRRLGFTQEGLAKVLGVHPMTVSRWERGTVNIPEPPAKLLRLLAAQRRSLR